MIGKFAQIYAFASFSPHSCFLPPLAALWLIVLISTCSLFSLNVFLASPCVFATIFAFFQRGRVIPMNVR